MRRLDEPVKFLFLMKMGLLGNQARTKKSVINYELCFGHFGKGTSINDVRRFLEIFDLPTYLCPIMSLLEEAAYLMTSFFV